MHSLMPVMKVRRVSSLIFLLPVLEENTFLFTEVMTLWLRIQRLGHSFTPCTENVHHKHADGDTYYMSIK